MNRILPTFLLFGILFSGCSRSKTSWLEHGNLATVVSPGRDYVAVANIDSSGGGAMGSSYYLVHVGAANSGSSHDGAELVFEGLHACDVKLEWTRDFQLAIEYNGADCNIKRFRNYWYDPESIEKQRPTRVEIVLKRR